ncbi:expressed unknown protein [Seminavis robusta]|uniref:Uncharacterized protein n=1 Tax=Seminavis robusta TaxID=568900 RepID=A0A9N8ESC7_9STRA|nr:expressed unknown protein [Seminavis robusta]|eukprot:Sro1509_g278500.1 n/a (177) ;mRNA; r:2436-3116
MPRFRISVDSRNHDETRHYLGNGQFCPPHLSNLHHHNKNLQDEHTFMNVSLNLLARIDEEFGAELKAIWAANKVTNQGPFQAPMTPCNARNQARISWFLNARQGGQRNFFPENESRPTRNAKMLQPKIRNIDWHLATTVQQVVSLSLDGTHSSDIRGGIATGTYQPPTPVHCQRTD